MYFMLKSAKFINSPDFFPFGEKEVIGMWTTFKFCFPLYVRESHICFGSSPSSVFVNEHEWYHRVRKIHFQVPDVFEKNPFLLYFSNHNKLTRACFASCLN